MNSVATIVVKKGEAETLKLALEAVRSTLQDRGAVIEGTVQLGPAEASEIAFECLDGPSARLAVQDALQNLPADYCISSINHRRKKLMLADMDSTIIEIECIDALATMVNLEHQIAPITEAAMRGEIEFRAALEKRVRLLAGLEQGILEKVYQDRVTLSDGARELVAVMRASGARTVLVSGGFTYFADRVGEDVGFDLAHSNQLEIIDGRLSGQIIGQIMDANGKRQCLLDHCANLNIEPRWVMALGDGANDLLMMQEAGLSISYCGKPAVEKGADGIIRHTSLKSALFFQGFSQKEIENSLRVS